MKQALLAILFALSIFPLLAFVRSMIAMPLRLVLARRVDARHAPAMEERSPLPEVVVQLPVYRESLVLERLLKTVVAMRYPPGRLSVQVIDDSEDEEAARCRAIVDKFRGHPVPIRYLHREDRSGYKAGALNYGLERTAAPLVAIFDADFEPRSDFLAELVPLFEDGRVAAVQARWDYSNSGTSPLTQFQAGVFDKMFCFEQQIRTGLGRPALFLGTNGIWRKQAIESVGGWKTQPFTSEDIDLSYRVHVAGWKVLYNHRALAVSELPDNYLAYIAQQRRWARGVTRVLLDHIGTMAGQRRTLAFEFFEASLLVFQVGMPLSVFLPVIMLAYIAAGFDRSTPWLVSQVLLTASLVTAPVIAEIMIAQKLLYRDWQPRVWRIFKGLPVSVGLAIGLFAGLVETLTKSQAEYVRTPKGGEPGRIKNNVRKWLLGSLPIIAGGWVLAVTTAIALALAMSRGYWEAVVLLAAMSGGYLAFSVVMLRELRQKSRTSALG